MRVHMPPEPEGDVYARIINMMDRLAGPAFTVRFLEDDLIVEHISIRHFFLPQAEVE